MGEFVTGDTGPDMEATLHELLDSADIEDLNSVTEVRFQMRKDNDRRYTVDAVATIVDPDTGAVRYSWAANDLSVKGTYKAQWQLTYAGGKTVTTSTGDVVVRRQ